MYHKIRLNSTYCCAALQKNCTFFTKKTHFRLYEKQKTESQGSPSARFFCFMLYRGWGAAFCHISCRGCDTLRFPYPCRAAAGAPRFVRPLPHCRCGAAVFLFHAVPRLGRCILSDLCRTAAGALCFVRPLLRRRCGAAFCQTPAAPPSVMHRRRSLPPG